jgi:taurine dioxygenase
VAYETITVTPVGSSLGARVDGMELARGLDSRQIEELHQALLEHQVLFMPAQDIDDDAQIALARTFGEPHPHPVGAFLGDTSLMGNVATDDYRPGIDSHFHTDYTFHTEVPDVAVLRAVVVPGHGGDTMWANACDAYDALSAPMREFLDGLDAFHSQGPIFNDIIIRRFGEEAGRPILDAFPGATHPMVTTHPGTGREALFVNQGYTRSVVGLTAAESDALLAFLFAHMSSPRFVCRYRWSVGDIAIWDERATVHMGEGTYWPAERLMRRITAGSAAPNAAPRARGQEPGLTTTT